MTGVTLTLAGACLRPLGHLSVAAPYKANGLGRKGNLPMVTLRSAKPSLQFLAAKNGNETGLCGHPRTQRVQAVLGLDTETVMTKPDEPRRAYVLDLKVQADDLDSLVGYLRTFEYELLTDKISRGVSGGYSAGSVYSLNVDETITHDAWAEANQRYVDWLVARDAIEARAREIYDAMPFDEPSGVKPAWVPGGNSRKQDEARQLAQAERQPA